MIETSALDTVSVRRHRVENGDIWIGIFTVNRQMSSESIPVFWRINNFHVPAQDLSSFLFGGSSGYSRMRHPPFQFLRNLYIICPVVEEQIKFAAEDIVQSARTIVDSALRLLSLSFVLWSLRSCGPHNERRAIESIQHHAGKLGFRQIIERLACERSTMSLIRGVVCRTSSVGQIIGKPVLPPGKR